jgi:hypothetical protein
LPEWYEAYRDVALAVLGAATGLASVLLVFVGFLLANAASFPAGTDEHITNRYTRMAKAGMIPVSICIVVMLASFSWLFHPTSIWLLKVWTWGFATAGWTFLIYGIVAVLGM